MTKLLPTYMLAGFCFLTPEIQGQITITAADFNVITIDSIVFNAVDTTGLMIPAAGANQVWDYSGMVTDTTLGLEVGPHVATSAGSSIYPTANALVRLQNEAFYIKDNSALTYLGRYYHLQAQPFYDSLYDPGILLQFPFTYGDSHTDSTKTTSVRPTITANAKGEIVNEVIGYGELRVPGMVHSDVLLVRIVTTSDLTLSTGGSFALIEANYVFFTANNNFPVMQYDLYTSTETGAPVTTKSVFYTGTRTTIGLQELAAINESGLSLFPNPATDLIQVKGIIEDSEFRLFNESGQQVQQGVITLNDPSIGIEGLTTGVYLVLVETNGQSALLRLIKN